MSVAAAVLLALGAAGVPAARAAGVGPATLATGFTDGQAFEADPADRAIALTRAKQAGATYVRIGVGWADVAPQAPPSSAAAQDPSWSGYNFAYYDRLIADIEQAGMVPIVVISVAPDWAQGPNRPPGAYVGAWDPSPAAFADFATAIARRYSGGYSPIPGSAPLPRVRVWQAWNEPNISIYLAPQWKRVNGQVVAASPDLYRALLNGFYTAVKGVDPSNTVVSAGTEPYGDPHPGVERIGAAQFYRLLFCEDGTKPPAAPSCPGLPVHLDVAATHPYPGIHPQPNLHDPQPNDIGPADIGRLTSILTKAHRSGAIAAGARTPVWATEIAWDSNPPDHTMGVPLQQQARYLEGALYTLWSEGVSNVIWWRLRDMTPTGPTFMPQSGLYFEGASMAAATPKPALTAFRFPFTGYRQRGVAQIWGMVPTPGTVIVEQARHGRYVRIAQVRARPGHPFLLRRRLARGTVLRARLGSQTSLTWTVS